MSLRGTLLLGLLAGVLGCSRQAAIPAGLEPNPISSDVAIQPVGQEPVPDFLQAMVTAPFTVAYHGTRRIELHYSVSGAPDTVEYRESVGSNGAGEWSIETLEVLTPDQMAPDLFMLLMDSRANFTYQYRDFRIRNLAFFQATFSLFVTATQVECAGIHCTQMRIQRAYNARTFYDVWVDPASGVVLKWVERRMEGQLVALMEFETFAYSAPEDDAVLHGPEYPLTPVDLHGDTTAIGFSHLVPQLVPVGYRITSADKLMAPDGTDWIKQVYTDGVESIVFLYGGPEHADASPGVVEYLQAGPWHVVTGELLVVVLLTERFQAALSSLRKGFPTPRVVLSDEKVRLRSGPPIPGYSGMYGACAPVRGPLSHLRMTSQPDQPFDDGQLNSPEYRERLMKKLNCLIAVLEVANAKVKRSLTGPEPDVSRLTKIQTNLSSTLEVCRRARRALERREGLPSELPQNLADVVGSARYSKLPGGARYEMSSSEEHARFDAMGSVKSDEIAACDFDDLARRLMEG